MSTKDIATTEPVKGDVVPTTKAVITHVREATETLVADIARVANGETSLAAYLAAVCIVTGYTDAPALLRAIEADKPLLDDSQLSLRKRITGAAGFLVESSSVIPADITGNTVDAKIATLHGAINAALGVGTRRCITTAHIQALPKGKGSVAERLASVERKESVSTLARALDAAPGSDEHSLALQGVREAKAEANRRAADARAAAKQLEATAALTGSVVTATPAATPAATVAAGKRAATAKRRADAVALLASLSAADLTAVAAGFVGKADTGQIAAWRKGFGQPAAPVKVTKAPKIDAREAVKANV